MTEIVITTKNGSTRVVVDDMVVDNFTYKVDKKNGTIEWSGKYCTDVDYDVDGHANSWSITTLKQT